ncbi:hypothetical protein KY306_01515 [Candidatus Woesearchaeota archaeon]|nr:hypothetical protein [Candidatus Woesearchaeota archaeon]
MKKKKKKAVHKHHKHHKKAKKEMASAKKKLIAAEKKVLKFVKTHPAKAAAMATGIAAAIGGIAAGTVYLVKKKKK